MTYTNPGTRKGLTAAFFGAAIAMPFTTQAALNDIVIITGESSDTPFVLTPQIRALDMPAAQIDLEEACRRTKVLIAKMTWPLVMSRMGSHLFGVHAEGTHISDQVDCSEAERTEGRYTIMFASCSMLMTDGVHTMRWIVPPDAPEAQMIIANAQTGQIINDGNVMLETSLSELGDVEKGRVINQYVKPASGSNSYDVQLEIGPTGNYEISTETYAGQKYRFYHSGRVDIPGMEVLGWTITTDGAAWISPDVPGSDVVAKFYENFENYVTPATGQGTLYTAMIEQMAKLVAYGMPLETEQTVEILDAGSKSTSKVKSITVWQGAASEHQVCGQFQTPEGFEEVSMQQVMSGTNASPDDAQEMNEAMQQYNEAMQNMTPEQKQIMEQLGMGDIMQQAPAANPAAQSAGTTSGRSDMPSSEELYSDDLTQMVQNHLYALGYDTGNTSGEMSLETTIAISQFQAERGLEVTGEVSPQLAGLLSAEVDKRR